jgi:hypothetical protein
MKVPVFCFFCFISTISYSQKDTENIAFKVNADLVSRYVWRGSDYFNSPAVQPDMEIAYKNIVGVGARGSMSIANQPIQETDWFVYTNVYKFSFYIYDYFYMNNQLANNHYFNYKSSKTGHTISADLSYTFSAQYPFAILASYNVWGNDTLHSSYVELSYTPTKYPIQIFCGGTFDKGWYGHKAGIVNVGVQLKKDIIINDKLSLPFKIQCIVNPMTENIFIVAILSL